MMKKTVLICSIFAGASAAIAAPAASSDITVKGIVSPSSCSLVMSNNDVTYGEMTTLEVQGLPLAGDVYTLPAKTVNVVANCLAPTKFGLAVVDNRAGSAKSAQDFGLGVYTDTATSAVQNVGHYSLTYAGHTSLKAEATGPYTSPAHYFKMPGIASATGWTEGGTVFSTADSVGFAIAAGATGPDSLTEAKLDLTLQSYLYKTLVDAAAEKIIIDGSTTITMTVF